MQSAAVNSKNSSQKRPRLSVGFVLKSMAGRLFLPRHWPDLFERMRKKELTSKAADDPALRLFGQLVPGGFLNYGYHENPALTAEKMCIDDIERAQVRFGERLVNLVTDREQPVLDCGCGLGGLTELLLRAGYKPTALTPNSTQVARVRANYPDVPVIQRRLEQIPLPEYQQAFGTVITSESFQYVTLAQGLEVLGKILRPGGRWILCDYFRSADAVGKSGHRWSEFSAAVQAAGWRTVLMEDITAHVLPTIDYVHMWGRRFGLPVEEFAAARLLRKRPVLHFLLEDVLAKAHERIQHHLEMVDPAVFARERKYITLVLER